MRRIHAPPLIVIIHAIEKGERDAQNFRPKDGSRYSLILKVLEFGNVRLPWSQQQVEISGSLSPYKNAYGISVRQKTLFRLA
jgi:hypothetical protein